MNFDATCWQRSRSSSFCCCGMSRYGSDGVVPLIFLALALPLPIVLGLLFGLALGPDRRLSVTNATDASTHPRMMAVALGAHLEMALGQTAVEMAVVLAEWTGEKSVSVRGFFDWCDCWYALLWRMEAG